MRIYEASAFDRLSRAAGSQDVPTGDENFDRRWIVRANQSDRAFAWIPREVREHVQPCGHYRFSVGAGKVQALLKKTIDKNAASLSEAIRATGALARCYTQLEGLFYAVADDYGGEVHSCDGGKLKLTARFGRQALEVTHHVDRKNVSCELTVQVPSSKVAKFEFDAQGPKPSLSGDEAELARTGVAEMLEFPLPAEITHVDWDGVRLRLRRGPVDSREQLQQAIEFARSLADALAPDTMYR